jgi:hypothetical protein
MEGAWQVAASFDAAGGMAKSPLDLAMLSDVLLQSRDSSRPSLAHAVQETWNGISVGFVDIEVWCLPVEVHGDVPGYKEQTVEFLLPIYEREDGRRQSLTTSRFGSTTLRSTCFEKAERALCTQSISHRRRGA